MLKRNLAVMISMILLFGFLSQLHAERNPKLPRPFATASVERRSVVIGWQEGETPIAPAGFKVSVLASLESPRSLYLLPSGDVLVSQSRKGLGDSGETSPNRITILKMRGSTLLKAETFAENLQLPFGMAVWGSDFYVGEPHQVRRFLYENGKISGTGQVIAQLPFPPPRHHWTRHLLLSSDGKKLYVSVGSASNIGEGGDPLDPRNAAILEMNRDGTNQKIFASGLRNAVSMAWEPVTGALWAVVNERDELGDSLPPDYITHVQRGGFYGWPYAYWGTHEDPRLKGKRPDLVAKTLVPDFSVGNHTAALGITFTTGTKVPSPFNQGALIAEHGSWNSSVLTGYKVHYVAFENGQPLDQERDFLTGFIADEAKSLVHGRPVSTVVLADGTILVSDDAGGKIWKVSPVAQ